MRKYWDDVRLQYEHNTGKRFQRYENMLYDISVYRMSCMYAHTAFFYTHINFNQLPKI